MFVHLDTLAAIQSRVENGDSPCTGAHEAFMSDVRDAMAADSESVTFNGAATSSIEARRPRGRKAYVAAVRTRRRLGDGHLLPAPESCINTPRRPSNCWTTGSCGRRPIWLL